MTMKVSVSIKSDTITQSLKRHNMLFNVLSGVLNELHNLDYSERFWRILLQDHVRAVSSRRELMKAEDNNRKPGVYPLNGKDYPSQFKRTKHYLIETGKFFQHLPYRGKVDELLEYNHTFKIGFPEVKAVEEDRLGESLPEYFFLFMGGGKREKREELYKIAERFDDVYLKNCIKELPMIWVEYFMNMHNRIQLWEPRKKVFHIHFMRSVYMLLLVAKYGEYGAKLIWYQHGGENGELEMGTGHYVRLSYSDEFRTWGWKIEEKEVPWKAYRLDLFRNSYFSVTKREPRYDLLLCYPNITNSNRKYYKNFSKKLLTGLKSAYSHILARPRRTNKIHSHAYVLKFIDDPRTDISSGLKPIADEIAVSRLVVQVTVPSTNFLECIYVDKPVIGILNNDQPSSVIKPFYDFFLSTGVLHESVESMAEHLNRIDIEDWWSGLMNEPMYKAFKNTFTRDTGNNS